MTIRCPTCGHPLKGGAAELAALSEIRCSNSQRKVLKALIKAYPKSVTTEQLVFALYSDDATGGPLGAEATVKQYVYYLRNLLPEYGWDIPKSTVGRGNRGIYRLAMMAEGES